MNERESYRRAEDELWAQLRSLRHEGERFHTVRAYLAFREELRREVERRLHRVVTVAHLDGPCWN